MREKLLKAIAEKQAKRAEVVISHKTIDWLENFTSLEELQTAIVDGEWLDVINSMQELPSALKESIYYAIGDSMMSGDVSISESIRKLRVLLENMNSPLYEYDASKKVTG